MKTKTPKYKGKTITKMTDTAIQKRFDELEQKLDIIIQALDRLGNSGSSKVSRKKQAPKIETFKLSTKNLLESSELLCAYMQRSEDCEGHCGKQATHSVIRDQPVLLTDLDDLEEAKNERAELLRRSFLRCNGCKSKAQKMENSRAYKEVRKFLYKQTGEDTAVAADLDAMMGSPSRKGKKSEKPKKIDSSGLDDQPTIAEGLDDPEDPNPNLIKTSRWSDKFVKVGKKNMIVRSYSDSKKKDVCIGLIDEEPVDDQYEQSLRKPSKSFLEKVGLVYMTPENSLDETPPKAKKLSVENESDDEQDIQKTERKKPTPVKKSTPIEDMSEDDDDDEAEAFRDMADSD